MHTYYVAVVPYQPPPSGYEYQLPPPRVSSPAAASSTVIPVFQVPTYTATATYEPAPAAAAVFDPPPHLLPGGTTYLDYDYGVGAGAAGGN